MTDTLRMQGEAKTPRFCEFCHRRITDHDREQAPYSDGKYLCKICWAEYMDLHHHDPFRGIKLPHHLPEVVTA